MWDFLSPNIPLKDWHWMLIMTWVHNSQAIPIWANYLTFLGLSLSFCKTGLIKDQPNGVREKNQCGVENHTWVFLNFPPRELVNGNPLELGSGSSGMGWELLTVEVEAVLIQRVGAQTSDAMGLPAQLMEQLLGRQTWAAGGLTVDAEKVHPCLGAILHRPGEEEVDFWGMQFS